MSFIRQLETSRKLLACFAILLCLSTVLSLWLLGQMSQLTALTAKTGQKLSAAQAEFATVRLWSWFFMSALLGAGAALALWLRAEVARPVEEAAEMARRVAGGDLGSRIEEGAATPLLCTLQDMNDKLAGMIIKVRSGTENIAGSAGEMAAGSMDLAVRTAEQAASLKETASAMEQLTCAARHNAGQAGQASSLALSACTAAVQAGEMVAGMVDATASLYASSRRIADIGGVIDGLARQTGFLARNAEAEAARAGEQGSGFAVVAGEVRALAQRSSAAAREIRRMVEDCAAQAGAGGGQAALAGAAMREVIGGVQRVAAIAGDIAQASAGQSADIEQISLAIMAMDQASGHNTGLLERAAAAAASMRDQAGNLSRATAAFSLGKNHALAGPALHLVSNNPHKLARLHADGKPRARPQPLIRAVASNPPSPGTKPGPAQRGHGSAVRHDLDWEEF